MLNWRKSLHAVEIRHISKRQDRRVPAVQIVLFRTTNSHHCISPSVSKHANYQLADIISSLAVNRIGVPYGVIARLRRLAKKASCKESAAKVPSWRPNQTDSCVPNCWRERERDCRRARAWQLVLLCPTTCFLEFFAACCCWRRFHSNAATQVRQLPLRKCLLACSPKSRELSSYFTS